MTDLVMRRRIAAPPSTVFPFLVDRDRLLRWLGVAAEVDAVVGGRLRVDMTGDDVMEGEYLEIVPDRRVRFSWGWIGQAEVPPGSTTVTIELAAAGDDTLLTLTHAGLPDGANDPHAAGWTYFLARLGQAARGSRTGPVAMDELNTTNPILEDT